METLMCKPSIDYCLTDQEKDYTDQLNTLYNEGSYRLLLETHCQDGLRVSYLGEQGWQVYICSASRTVISKRQVPQAIKELAGYVMDRVNNRGKLNC